MGRAEEPRRGPCKRPETAWSDATRGAGLAPVPSWGSAPQPVGVCRRAARRVVAARKNRRAENQEGEERQEHQRRLCASERFRGRDPGSARRRLQGTGGAQPFLREVLSGFGEKGGAHFRLL